MRVLGVDPGITTCGYGVVAAEVPGQAVAMLDYGAVCPRERGAARLVALYAALRELVRTQRPDVAVVERLYYNRNVRTAMEVGEARGVVLLALAQAGIPIAHYTPTEVKLAVTGNGQAPKAQVAAMVRAQLSLPTRPRPDDAADALALCLCHLQGESLRQRLAAAEAASSVAGRWGR